MRREYQTMLPVSWETCMQDKKQQLELNMKQQIGSKFGKEYVKAVYCHHAYLTSVKSTQCEIWGWMKHKLELRLPAEIWINSYAYDTTLMAEREEEVNSLLMKVKEESEKSDLQLNIQKTKIMESGLITSWQIGATNVETVSEHFIFLDSKINGWWLLTWN